MRRSHTWLLAAAIGFGFAQVASAADMPVKGPVYKAPPPQVYNWTGCYVGANVGWAHSKHDLSTYADAFPLNAINNTARTAIINAGSAGIDDDSFTGGGQVGCNWQMPNTSWVLGARATSTI